MVCSLIGCSSIPGHFNYNVEIKNKGNQLILVEPFQITDGPFSTVEVGEVYPNNGKAMAPFYRKPFPNLTIMWRVPTTGATGQAQVRLDLPKEFTKESGSSIDFYIYPDKQQVEVAFYIINPTTGETKTVRQQTSK